MLTPGTYLQNRYEIIDRIGAGGMADVYKAMCHTLNRLVAIKVLKEEYNSDDNFVNRFKMEAQAVARLSHPNIVNVYDVVDDENLHYIVMELVEGITLKSYISKKGHLEPKETIGIAIQMAQGMYAAHQQNIIHRDIKPQNIMISMDGKVKVADFGIARAASSNTVDSRAIGSVHYVSPEQAKGEKVDARSDIYSLGITMFEMATGRLPFNGDNSITVAMAHLESPITPPKDCNPDIPDSLERIILRCTEKKPEDRYQDADEVIRDLRRALLFDEEERTDPVLTAAGARKTAATELDAENHADREGRGDGINSADSAAGANSAASANSTAGVSGAAGAKNGSTAGEERAKRRRSAKNQKSDITRQLEHVFTATGIVAALVLLGVIIYVLLRLGGLFRSAVGTDGPGSASQQTESMEVTTAALADGQVLMPDLTGVTQNQAASMLQKLGLKLAVSSVETSDTYSVGSIMAQEFQGGTALEKNTVVHVKVSKGSGTTDLGTLNLVGMEEQSAKTLLTGRSLVVVTQQESSETIPEGTVIRFDPQILKDGETVTLTISTGSTVKKAAVPDLSAMTADQANEALVAAGFIPAFSGMVSSDTVGAGLVVSQSKNPGTQAEQGTEVSYQLSSGPQNGESVGEAQIVPPQPAGSGSGHYTGSIDRSYNLKMGLGPGYTESSIQIVIRLKQVVNGKVEYQDLISPRTVIGDTKIPISFSNIEGANGVLDGEVEVVDLDHEKVLVSYPVSFFPTN